MVNKIKLKFAIRACCLEDSVTPQLLHYYVKKQEQKELEQGLKNKEGMIIDLSTASCDTNLDIEEEDGTATTNTLPLTEPSALLSLSDSFVAADEQEDEEEKEDSNNRIFPAPFPPPAHDDAIESTRTQLRKKRRTRRSSRQASLARLDAKEEQMEYSARFKAAFKEATKAIAANEHSSCTESVPSLVAKFNSKYNLNGKRKLTR
jgi:hypothetical protein